MSSPAFLTPCRPGDRSPTRIGHNRRSTTPRRSAGAGITRASGYGVAPERLLTVRKSLVFRAKRRTVVTVTAALAVLLAGALAVTFLTQGKGSASDSTVQY